MEICLGTRKDGGGMKKLFQMLVVVRSKALQGTNPQNNKSGAFTMPTELVAPEVVLPRRLP